MDWTKINDAVIAEFRASGGKVAQFGDLPVVLLHTIGARTKTLRLVPLILIHDGDDQLLFGSAAGSQQHPAWVHNVRAQPDIDVELGTERFAARIEELDPAEARRRAETQESGSKQFADYVKSAAPRQIPVFRLTRP